jgi:hypothetical protein
VFQGKRRDIHKSSLTEEFKKAKRLPLMEKLRKEKKSRLVVGFEEVFWVHNYSENTKARISIFNLNGGASIWWEDLKEIKGLKERKLTWKQFEKYLKGIPIREVL